MTREQTGRIEAAIIDALWRNPMTSSELTTELHRADKVPPYWEVENVRSVLRRLHQRGVLSRLDSLSVTRYVMWWAA